MPGVHTFYDGSRVLEPLAQLVGIEVDKVNLVFCQVLSLPLAYIYYVYFAPGKVSRQTRLAYSMMIGVAMCLFCYGRAIKHLLGNAGVCYALFHITPNKYIHKVIFVFSMGYLTFIHWYRWYVLTTYNIDITGVMMVLVQKMTTVAFSLHDGRVKKEEELNDIQKRERISVVPPLLDYLSYLFCFQTVLTGPLCFYADYTKFIDGTHVTEGARGKQMPVTPWRAVRWKLLQSVFFLAIVLKFGSTYAPERFVEPAMMRCNMLMWIWYLYVIMAVQRMQYYFAWVLAEAICNASGFGFSGYDASGKPVWDLCSNVDAWKCETALNFKDTLDAWNCTTMYWLRRVAYDRTPTRYRTVCTYVLSAWWHGFFPGYYLTFLSGAVFTSAGRRARRCLRFRFQSTAQSRLFYDALTFVATKIALAYAAYPFVTMHFNPGFFVFTQFYFAPHIIALAITFLLPVILPPQSDSSRRESVQEETGRDGEDAKKNGKFAS